jgi:hypothetical protein
MIKVLLTAMIFLACPVIFIKKSETGLLNKREIIITILPKFPASENSEERRFE